MIPEIGQHIKCVLKYNGMIIEGTVEEWSESSSRMVLLSLDGESKMILPNADDDILLIKIVLPKKEVVVSAPEHKLNKNELEMEFQKVYDEPSGDDLRTKKLAELKKLLIEQDKKIIIEKLKDHHIGNTKAVTYGQPGFYKKSSIK